MKQYMNCESKVWTYELLDWIDEEKIDWGYLSENPNAIHLLEKNPKKIDWRYLSIFTKKINYEYLYQRMNVIREEMMMKCMHPSRLERWIEMGGDVDDF
jgi:hypothetical protein